MNLDKQILMQVEEIKQAIASIDVNSPPKAADTIAIMAKHLLALLTAKKVLAK